MAFYTPTTNSKLTVTNWNTYVRNRLVNYFTSTANRDAEVTAPTEGMVAYTADTDTFWYYSGSAWLALMKPSYGRGYVTQATKTGVQSGVTTVTDVTGLSISFTAEASRRYRISLTGMVASNTSNDSVQLQITNASNTVLNFGIFPCPSNGYSVSAAVEYFVVPGAGSVTYKARILRNTGSGSVIFDSGTTYPAYLTAQDIGT